MFPSDAAIQAAASALFDWLLGGDEARTAARRSLSAAHRADSVVRVQDLRDWIDQESPSGSSIDAEDRAYRDGLRHVLDALSVFLDQQENPDA